jgi:hypothetical protein
MGEYPIALLGLKRWDRRAGVGDRTQVTGTLRCRIGGGFLFRASLGQNCGTLEGLEVCRYLDNDVKQVEVLLNILGSVLRSQIFSLRLYYQSHDLAGLPVLPSVTSTEKKSTGHSDPALPRTSSERRWS